MQKIKVIRSRVDADWWGSGVMLVRHVSEMRNRLMHFKDQPDSADIGAVQERGQVHFFQTTGSGDQEIRVQEIRVRLTSKVRL